MTRLGTSPEGWKCTTCCHTSGSAHSTLCIEIRVFPTSTGNSSVTSVCMSRVSVTSPSASMHAHTAQAIKNRLACCTAGWPSTISSRTSLSCWIIANNTHSSTTPQLIATMCWYLSDLATVASTIVLSPSNGTHASPRLYTPCNRSASTQCGRMAANEAVSAHVEENFLMIAAMRSTLPHCAAACCASTISSSTLISATSGLSATSAMSIVSGLCCAGSGPTAARPASPELACPSGLALGEGDWDVRGEPPSSARAACSISSASC